MSMGNASAAGIRGQMALYVRVIGDTKQFEGAMGNVSAGLKTVAAGLIGGFGLGFAAREIANTVRDAAQYAAQLKDAAEAFEISPAAVQGIREAGFQYGASVEKMDSALQRLQASQAALAGGDPLMAQAFSTLGISEVEARALGLDALLAKIGQRLSGVKNNTAEYDAALQLLGKRGMGNVVNAARQMGEQGLGTFIDGLEDTGRLFDEQMIEKIDRADKALQRLGQQWRTFWGGLASEFIPETPEEAAKSAIDQARLQAMLRQIDKEQGPVDYRGGMAVQGLMEARIVEARRRMAEEDAKAAAEAKKKSDAEAEALAREQILSEIKREAANLDEQIMQARISDAEKLELIEQRIADLKAKAAAEGDDVVRGRLENQIRQLELAGIPIKKAVDAQYEKDYEDQRRRGEQEERERGRADVARRAQAAERSAIERGEGVTVASPVAADRLAAIGGRVGLQTAMEANAVQRQIQISIQMRDYLKRIAETRIEPGVVA